MLADDVTYEELERDPTLSYRNDLNNLVDYGFYKGVLNKKETFFLVPSYSRVPTIYTPPKVYKDPLNPLARPIVNGIGSIASRVGPFSPRKCDTHQGLFKGHHKYPTLLKRYRYP